MRRRYEEPTCSFSITPRHQPPPHAYMLTSRGMLLLLPHCQPLNQSTTVPVISKGKPARCKSMPHGGVFLFLPGKMSCHCLFVLFLFFFFLFLLVHQNPKNAKASHPWQQMFSQHSSPTTPCFACMGVGRGWWGKGNIEEICGEVVSSMYVYVMCMGGTVRGWGWGRRGRGS